MKVPPIEKCIRLCIRIGRARTARIRYAQRGTGRKQTGKAINITNPVIDTLHTDMYGKAPAPIMDILYGVANASEDGNKALNTNVLLTILETMPEINSREVQIMLACTPRAARKYIQAIQVALPFVLRYLKARRPPPNQKAAPP